MALSNKQVSPEKEFEHMVQKDNELSKLACIYKKFESERGSGLKPMKVTKLLRRENWNVLRDLCACKSTRNRAKEKNMFDELKNVVRQRTLSINQIQKTTKELDEVSGAISKEKKKIETILARVTTDVQWSERMKMAESTLDTLENKLDTVVKQYGVLTSENYQLRKEVEHMLIERQNFNKLWDHFVKNLSQGKALLMDILEQATMAYDQRDEYVVRLSVLRTLALRDLHLNTEEMLALQGQLDHDYKLKEFVGFKHQFRNMGMLLAAKIKKQNEYQMMMGKALYRLTKILEDIKKFTGVNVRTNMDEFVFKYTTRETQNMSYFYYITDLHKEMELVNTGLVKRQLEIVKQTKVKKGYRARQKANLIKLRRDLNAKTLQADQANGRLEDINLMMENIYGGIQHLFKICRCKKAPFLQLLGDNSTIDNYNVLLYLRVLEETIDVYLANQYYNEQMNRKNKVLKSSIIDESTRSLQTFDIGTICPTNPCPLCIEREMVTDVVDTLQFVDTRESIRLKLGMRLNFSDGLSNVHNVSACNLPKSREIMHKRYQ